MLDFTDDFVEPALLETVTYLEVVEMVTDAFLPQYVMEQLYEFTNKFGVCANYYLDATNRWLIFGEHAHL